MHRAKDVAKWFLAHNREIMEAEDSEYISNLKLQKLLYYAQGTFLAVTDHALFADPIVAWKHGPVVESVYHEYSSNGAKGIVFDEGFDPSTFTPEENDLLTQVYDVFGQYSAWKLRDMTHQETPWQTTEPSAVISNDKIRDYFKQEYIE